MPSVFLFDGVTLLFGRMGELLRLYMGRKQKTSEAFWVGASRVLDSSPLVTADVAERLVKSFGKREEDDWEITADELRDAVIVAASK